MPTIPHPFPPRSDDSSGASGAAMVELLVATLVIGLVAGAGGVFLAVRPSSKPAAAAAECAKPTTITVAADPVVFDVVAATVAELHHACVSVEAMPRTGANVASVYADSHQLPDIWISDSPIWRSSGMLGRGARLRTMAGSLATSPVLLVGGPRAPRFATWGEAESSGLVSTPDPLTTSSAASALTAPLAEAASAGRTLEEAQQVLVPFAQDYGDRHSRGLDADVQLLDLDERSTRVQVATESDLLAVAGDRSFLRSVTPATGAPFLDYSLTIADHPRSVVSRVAREMVDSLRSPAGVDALHAAGLRVRADEPPPGSTAVVGALTSPRQEQVVAAVDSWRTLSVPSSMLAVVDASASMDFDAGGRTRMDLLAEAAALGIRLLPSAARVGLWTFSSDEGGPGRDWHVLEPTQRLDKLEHGRTQRYALLEQASRLTNLTGGGTGLYDTTLAAYRQAIREYRPAYANSVVLLTDGANDDPGSISLTRLVAELQRLRDDDKPVRVVAIGISDDADMAALHRIAAATGGQAYAALRPQDIATVFARALLAR